MNLMKLLSGDGFVMYNREIAHEVSVNGAIIFGQLCSSYSYFEDRNELTEFDGKKYFYITSEKLEEYTALSYKQQSKAIKELEKAGYIETKLKGLPATKYYHIVIDRILREVKSSSAKKEDLEKSTFSDDEQAATLDTDSFDKREKLELTKGENRIVQKGNEIININKNIKIKNDLIDNYQEPITNPKEFLSLMTDSINRHYAKFAPGRWSKDQFSKLINMFVQETIESGRFKNIPKDKVDGYVYMSLKNMADHHDYKRSEEFDEYKQIMSEPIKVDTADKDAPKLIKRLNDLFSE